MKLRPTLAALLLALGCTRPAAQNPPTTPAAAPDPGPDAPAAPDAAVAAPARPPVAELVPAEVRAVIDAWLRAQNEGDFAAYERLYAPRFTGIRRSGPRERRFDRAGWIADRQAMFRASMQVATRDVTVDPGAGVAMVRLTQEFTQGTFHDVGRKEIVLVRSGPNLLIAREEMLDSTLAAPAGQEVAAPAAGVYLPVVAEGSERWVILADAEDGWEEGEAEMVSPGEVVTTRRPARMSAIPEGLRGYPGQAIHTWGSDGAACEARLGALSVMSRIDVHFGTSQRWEGENEDGTRGAPMPPAEVAAEAWRMGAHVLVARLEGSCASAHWGRLASLPAAPAFAASTAPAPLTTAVLARFRALPAWRAAETAYRQDGAAVRGRSWDTHDGHAPVVTLWQAPGSNRRFATVYAATMVGGCAEFSASVTAVFEVTGASTLVLLSDGTNAPSLIPTGATDLDGDGRPEFVVEEGLFRRQGASYRLQGLYAVPNHDCPC